MVFTYMDFDIFALPDTHHRFRYDLTELTSEWDIMVQQIEILLFTKPGEFIEKPSFGVDLEHYIFETNVQCSEIERIVQGAINEWIIKPDGVDIRVQCKAYSVNDEPICVVDIIVKNTVLTRYFFK